MNISEIRQQYPQYSDLSDTELANALHDRFYPDVPIAEFYGKIGLATEDTKGFKAAAAAGFESLKGEAALTAGKVGLMDVAEAEAYQKEQEKKASARFTPTQDSWAESPWQKLKETAGGSAAYMALPAAAGLAALAAPAGIPAAAVGLGAAGLASGAQFVGTNLSRQMGTGKTLEETDLGAAAAAAVPQALLDTAALALMPGVGKLFGSVGAKLTTAEAKAIASQTFKQAATDYTAKTGMAMGREGATETVQQVLERLQAGLAIDDPEARKEYIESFIGGAALGGIFAPVGRYSERSGARTQVQDEQDTAERTAREESAQKEVDYKQSPQYITDIGTQFDALSAQFAQAKASLSRPGKDAPPAEHFAYKERQKALYDLNEKLKEAYPEYSKVQKAWEAQKAAQVQPVAQTPPQLPQLPAPQAPEARAPEAQAPEAQEPQMYTQQDVLPGFEAAAPITPMPEAVDYDQQIRGLEALRDSLGERNQNTTNLAEKIKLTQQSEQVLAAIEEAKTQKAKQPKVKQEPLREETVYKLLDKLRLADETDNGPARLKVLSELQALGVKDVADIAPRSTQKQQPLSWKLKDLGPNETKEAFAGRMAVKEEERQQDLRANRGQTREMFGEEPVQPEAQEPLKYENIKGEPVETLAATKEEATPLEPITPTEQARSQKVQAARAALVEADRALPEILKSKDQAAIDTHLKKINEAGNTLSRTTETQNKEQKLKPGIVLDLFDPGNIIRTAIGNGDTAVLSNIARHTDTKKLNTALDAAYDEKKRLVTALETRLDASGVKRERASIFEDMYTFVDPKTGKVNTDQIARFVNGNNEEYITTVDRDSNGKPRLDKKGLPVIEKVKLQDIYDKGGRAAVEYAVIEDEVNTLSKKVTTRQGNNKKSLYEQLVDLAAQHEALSDQIESGIATPTMREKTAALQAKLGEGAAPASRQMDAGELAVAKKKLAAIEQQYRLTEGKVTPIRDAILKKWDSLYTTTPVKKQSEIAAAKQAASDAEARKPKTVSKAAKTVKRINEGKVSKEAEASEKMRELARELGVKEEAYEVFEAYILTFVTAAGKRDNSQLASLKDKGNKLLEKKAIELGRKTPEYRAALKERVKYLQEAFASAGEQKLKSKRDPQVTRKVLNAPTTLRTGMTDTDRSKRAPLVTRNVLNASPTLRTGMTDTAITAELEGSGVENEYVDTDKNKRGVEKVQELNFDTPSTIDTKRKTNYLNAEATALAEDGQILALTDYIAANGATPRLKDMAARLRPLIMRTKLVVQDEVRHKGEKVAGIYAPAENTIYLARNHLSEEDFIHEAYHAATDRVLLEKDLANLTPSQRTARAALEGMWAALKDNPAFEGVHATSSVREFVAEVRTNELLRKKMEATGKPLTLWQRFKNAIKRLLKLDDVSQADSYIEEILQPSNKIIAPTTASQATPSLLRSKAEKPSDASLGEALAVARSLTAKKRTLWDDIRANGTGLSFATQFLDRFAGLEKISKLMEPLKGTQMMYFLRMYDQRMNFVSQAVANGALSYTEKTRKDGSVEYIVESKRGASLAGVAKILKDARTITGSGDNTSQLFTMYLAALRAERVGFSKLHFGNDITEAQLRAAKNTIDSNPALKKIFDSARTEYNAYNEGLVNFARDSGVFSDKEAALLTGSKDYIPFYRERNGVVELLIGGENPIKIGSIKEQPYLKDLVGGDTAILDFLTSSVQNTNMLIDMALRNKATKSAAYELNSIGMAKIVTNPTSGNDVVKFKEHGIDKYAILDTQSSGIPADIIVKGMDGIPVQMTGIMRMLQIPSTFLRKAITASPMYAARQLFRDSVAAPMLSGANMLPVIDAVRQIGSATKGTLESRGITGGQIFTGGQADLKDILRRVTDGKSSWLELLNKAETVAMEADAVTRRAQYNSYIKQGLSEMEATLLALESMNFNKRGASPSVHMANALIPFFNAQVQGLNVLYKALTGKMPFNDRLKTQEKLLTRGALMMATSLAYAAAMQDDEAYKNATPEQKYGNWFVRIPGMDEPLRIPVPFEVGYIFKALPEALYNTMVNEHGKEEAVEAFKQIMLQTIPGGSSYGIPQAMKPAIEAGLGKSFYTGRDLMSKREQMLLPEAQFREDTSELARSVGRNFGYSPIVFESLIRGYTGTMGMMLVQAVSAPFQSSDSPEKAVKRWSKVPVIGQAFQPNDAGYIINSVYDNMLELKSVKASVDDYIKRGEIAKAKELISERGDEYALASVADTFVKEMQNFTKAETATRASSLSPQEKQAQLEKIRKIKIQYAAMYREAFDKTKRQ